jgi:hypothetical protein
MNEDDGLTLMFVGNVTYNSELSNVSTDFIFYFKHFFQQFEVAVFVISYAYIVD